MKRASVFPVILLMLVAAACSKSTSDGSNPSSEVSIGGSASGAAAPVVNFLNQRGEDNCLMVPSSRKDIDIVFSYKVTDAESWEILVDGKSVGLSGAVWDDGDDSYEASVSVPVPCDNRSEHKVTMKVTSDAGSGSRSVTVVTRPCQGDDC